MMSGMCKTHQAVEPDTIVMIYRYGMDVTCVRRHYSEAQWLPLDINCPDPDEMLQELKALAKDRIDVWIHAAAVLDYIIPEPVEGKIASLQGE